MMVEVIEHGSGRGARALIPPGIVLAGKSGTSSDYRDSWFAGFSGSHLAVVWIGHDDNSPTGLTGSSGSLPVWSRLMANIGTTSWSAPLPESLQETWIEFPTGLGARPDCGEEAHRHCRTEGDRAADAARPAKQRVRRNRREGQGMVAWREEARRMMNPVVQAGANTFQLMTV